MSRFFPPGDCPACGEPVPRNAKACPHCGADERTGWSDDTYLDGVDLPTEDSESEYQRTTEREFGDGLPRSGRGWFALVVALLLALVISGLWALR
jgi:hypothetical protein